MVEKIKVENYSEIDKDREKIKEFLLKIEDLLVSINDIIKDAEEQVEKYNEALKTFKNSADKAQKEKLLDMSKIALASLEEFRSGLLDQKLKYEKTLAELEDIDSKLGEVLLGDKNINNIN